MAHLIRQQVLHVELNGTEADGLALQNRLSALCHNWLQPEIERIFDRSAPTEEHLYIEQLEVNLGTFDLSRLEQELPAAVAEALEKAIREKVGTAGLPIGSGGREVQLKTDAQVVWEAFLHFLQTGRLPWSFRLPPGETLETALQRMLAAGVPAVYVAETEHLIHSQTARKRLAEQFSEGFLATLLELINQQTSAQEQLTVAQLKASSRTDALPDDVPEPAYPETEALYVEDAGLVLLHPFLPQFFATMGVAQARKLLQPARALFLLHYLATGAETAKEYELVLPKILCGLPVDMPVEGNVELTEIEKAEANTLLEAVVRLWGALKNTSPDGLREAFLQRAGKLSRRNDDWLLQVEQRGHDLLLESLPWNIAVSQLPWMPSLLWTDWI
ncbi:contractile injection system tape measure protein [Hymenobacter sp. BT491]|uniref:contractile injection system tape measure protein n=1 Tax=Hymenobacter sp. BT491 TaxID=2766779 RepID=UPI001653C14A|nr:contractile injection system tape measure protein [Hymenobacter sp. BT491]MBC6989574.1 hypothetical protein [Hymenobacter sp. BT491]